MRIDTASLPKSARGLAIISYTVRPIGLAAAAAALLFVPYTSAQEVIHGTGALPPSPGEFAKLPKTPVYRAFLPESVDLSSRFPAPGDQGSQGACVGWAVGYAARSYYVGAQEGRNLRVAANIPSPAYIYGSILSNPHDCDSGSTIVDALNLLKKGALSKKDFPYNDKACPQPSQVQQSHATDFRIADWVAVDFSNLDQVKGELAKANPVIVNMRSSEHLKNLRRGEVYSETRTDGNDWHAIAVVGYDESKQAFKLINSWGTSWGSRGFGWISYPSFRMEVAEAYVMRPTPAIIERPEPAPVAIVKPSPELPPLPDVRPEPDNPVPAELFTGVECGHIALVQRGDGRVVTGFVGSDKDLKKVTEQAQAVHAEMDVQVRPWPQCELLLTLNNALSSPDKPKVQVEAKHPIEEGNNLVFSIATPSYPSFLHVAYIQADGSVLNLIQPDNLNLKPIPPNSSVQLGAVDGKGPKFKVSPPFGREMLVALASRSPLFGDALPARQTEREFLTALRKALLAKPDASAPDRVVSADFSGIVTSEATVMITEPVR